MSDLLFSLSLRVWHPTLHAAILISEFNLDVEASYSVNEPRKTPQGTLLNGIHSETYCCFLLKNKTRSRLDNEIIHSCEYLEQRADFVKDFARSGGTIEFYASIFLDGDGGFEVDRSLLQRILALGLGLSVEMYRLNDNEAMDY